MIRSTTEKVKNRASVGQGPAARASRDVSRLRLVASLPRRAAALQPAALRRELRWPKRNDIDGTGLQG